MKDKKGTFIGIIVGLICVSILIFVLLDKKEEIQEEPRIALRFAELDSEVYPTTKVDKAFSEFVNEMSDGHLQIIIYDSGKLGDERSIIEQVKFGGIDMARVSLDNMVEYLNDYENIPVPLIFDDESYDSKIEKIETQLFLQMIEKNLVPLFWIKEENRGICSKYRYLELESLINNKKIRVGSSQIMIDLYSQLDAQPVTMNEIDVYQGLQTDYVELLEDGLFSYYYERYFEQAPYFVETNYSIPSIVFVGRTTYNEFSYEIKELIRQAAEKTEIEQKNIYEKNYEELLNKIEKENIFRIKLTKEEKEKIKKTATEIYKKSGE
ncbi:TRAP transporter substrate-binding protein DctP [Clostridium sp. DL1XJH146]